MSKRESKQRRIRRRRIYRQIVQFANIFLVLAIVIFAVAAVRHTFTHKKDYYRAGMESYEQGAYSEAIEQFDKALDCKQWFAGEFNVNIMMWKADCYVRQKNFQEAAQVYADIRKEYSARHYDKEEISFRQDLMDALKDYTNGDYIYSITYFTKAVDMGYTDMCLYAASCYEHQKNFDKMAEYLDIYVQNEGITSYVCCKYADYWLYKGNFDTAFQYISMGLALEDKDSYQELKYLEILYYADTNNYPQAYVLAQAYTNAFPADAAGADILAFLETRINIDEHPIHDIYSPDAGAGES